MNRLESGVHLVLGNHLATVSKIMNFIQLGSLVPRPSRLGQSWILPKAVTSPTERLARSFLVLAGTTGQERTPRD